MKREELQQILKTSPLIAAVKDERGLKKALNCPCKVVFVLFGSVMNIRGIVKALKDADKTVFVHIDLIEGLSAKEVAVEFIARTTGADGILSTKQMLIKSAAAHGLLTVQRFFLIDSLALDTLKKQLNNDALDVLEILPGVCGSVISEIVRLTDKPVIASGLLRTQEEVNQALLSGASAVSGTNFELW